MGKDGYFIMIEGIILEERMSMNFYSFQNRASRYSKNCYKYRKKLTEPQ